MNVRENMLGNGGSEREEVSGYEQVHCIPVMGGYEQVHCIPVWDC